MTISETQRYVVYSVASANALAFDDSVEAALARCPGPRHGDSTEFYVVFKTTSLEDIDHFDGGRWPTDAEIVFRGENVLSQNYRA